MITTIHFRTGAVCVFASALLISGSALAFDADAAKELSKSNDCFKCHAPDKTKKGPSLKKIASKYAGKPAAEAEATMMKHMTTEPMVKLEDGSEEKHKIIDTKDKAQMLNIVQWILSHK